LNIEDGIILQEQFFTASKTGLASQHSERRAVVRKMLSGSGGKMSWSNTLLGADLPSVGYRTGCGTNSSARAKCYTIRATLTTAKVAFHAHDLTFGQI